MIAGTIALTALTCGTGAAIGVGVSALISGAMSAMSAQEDEDILGAFLGGAITGAVSSIAIASGATLALYYGGGTVAMGLGMLSSFAIGTIGGMMGNAYSQNISYGTVDWKVSAVTGVLNGINSAVGTYAIVKVPLINVTNDPFKNFTESLGVSVLGSAIGVYLGSLIPNYNDKRE